MIWPFVLMLVLGALCLVIAVQAFLPWDHIRALWRAKRGGLVICFNYAWGKSAKKIKPPGAGEYGFYYMVAVREK